MRVDLQTVKRRLGINLDASQFADWADRPVVLATAIEMVAHSTKGRVSEPA